MVRVLKLSRYKNNVGKYIGGALYVHKEYEGHLNIQEYKKCIPSDFDYTIVKYNFKKEQVSFIKCSTFDELPEPIVEESILVKKDKTIKLIKQHSDPFIYHHKWLMVKDIYKGFDVEQSKRRSETWLKIKDIDFSRIGKLSYWKDFLLKNNLI